MPNPMPQYGLAIHTASPDLGLALWCTAEPMRSQVWPLGRDTSSQLHQYLADFLDPLTWPDLAFLAVAKGPGGFTGTRIGVVVARTLAQQLQIPLFAISTLAAIARSEAQATQQWGPIAVQLPAHRGDLFGALYDLQPDRCQSLVPDQVFHPAEWQQTLAAWPTSYRLIAAEGGLGATVTGLLALAVQDWQWGDRPTWETALPFYGQHPVAQ